MIKSSPAREEIPFTAVRPGDLLDGGSIGVPRYVRCRSWSKATHAAHAVRHLRVDRKDWRDVIRSMDRAVDRIRREAAKRGWHVIAATYSHSVPPAYDLTSRELRAGLQLVDDQSIQHTLIVYPFGRYIGWRLSNHPPTTWRTATYARQIFANLGPTLGERLLAAEAAGENMYRVV